jgi:hypothetical protein
MARLVGLSPETLVAMEHIRETTLIRFNSLFTPERNLWNLHNLQRFHALFVEGFDEGEGTFLESLENSLSERTTTFSSFQRSCCTCSSFLRLSPGQKRR